jgi:hypothetical protein
MRAQLFIALAAALLARPGLAQEASPSGAPADEAGAAVEAAVGSLEKQVPDLKGRLAMMPIKAEISRDEGLARALTDRVAARLRASGADVLDASYIESLEEADRSRKNGRLNVPIERVATSYLQLDFLVTGGIARTSEGAELALKLVEARTEKPRTLATGSARFKPAAVAAPAPAVAADPPRPNPSADARVAIERDFFVERKRPDGSFADAERWTSEAPLAIDDRIQLHIHPLAPCYLCVIVLDTKKRMQRIYPDGAHASLADARVPAEWLKVPPVEGNFWLPIVGPAGTDTYFVVAESEPAMVGKLLAVPTDYPDDAATGAPVKPAAATPDAAAGETAARSEEEKRIAAQFEEEIAERAAKLDRLSKECERELVVYAREFEDEFRLRQAFRSIASGEPLLDGARLRGLGRPVLSGNAPVVPGVGGPAHLLQVGRVESALRVVESFTVSFGAAVRKK